MIVLREVTILEKQNGETVVEWKQDGMTYQHKFSLFSDAIESLPELNPDFSPQE